MLKLGNAAHTNTQYACTVAAPSLTHYLNAEDTLTEVFYVTE